MKKVVKNFIFMFGIITALSSCSALPQAPVSNEKLEQTQATTSVEPSQTTIDDEKSELTQPTANPEINAPIEDGISTETSLSSTYTYRDYFTLTFPSNWENKYHVEEYEADQDYNGRIEIAHAASWKANGGGIICTIVIYPSELWEEYKNDAIQFTSFGEKDGLSFVYTLASDVQYDTTNDDMAEEYNAMYDGMPEIIKNVTF